MREIFPTLSVYNDYASHFSTDSLYRSRVRRLRYPCETKCFCWSLLSLYRGSSIVIFILLFLLMFLKYISLNRNSNTLLKDLTWHNRCNANIITLPAPFKFKLSTLEWFLKQDNFRSFGGTLLHILGTQTQKHVAWWFNIWNDLIKNCQRKKVLQWIYAARFGAFRQAS